MGLGELWGGKIKEAVEFCTKACDLGSANGCENYTKLNNR